MTLFVIMSRASTWALRRAGVLQRVAIKRMLSAFVGKLKFAPNFCDWPIIIRFYHSFANATFLVIHSTFNFSTGVLACPRIPVSWFLSQLAMDQRDSQGNLSLQF